MKEQNRSATMNQLTENSDRKGLDYRTIENMLTPQECYDICLNEKGCMSFTYLGSVCYLKQGIPRMVSFKGAYSAAFPDKYICESVSDG